MGDFFYLGLSSPSSIDLKLEALPAAGPYDTNIYLAVYSDSDFDVLPNETLSVLITPSGTITPDQASGLLANTEQKSISESGIYLYRYTNTQSNLLSFKEFTIFSIPKENRTFENIRYDLHWLQLLDTQVIFNSYLSGIYTFPHNLSPSEVTLISEVTSGNARMYYNLTFPEVNNSGSSDYSGDNQPYIFSISYINGEGTVTGYFPDGDKTFTSETDYKNFTAGYASSGIIFEVPFYDPRTEDKVPALYYFNAGYNCADPVLTGSIPLRIPIDHQQMTLAFDDRFATKQLDPDKLRKIDESIFIARKTINRKRLSIGIKDITISQNKYKKKGTYISKPYSSDFPIYTFSLRADEYIPDYPNVNKYDSIQYFVEFNSKQWIRMSPINRDLEYASDGLLVPKLLVFDSNPSKENESVYFLDYQTPVNIFRIKIAFDVSFITGDSFLPPEVRDYECIIFDKNQMLEL